MGDMSVSSAPELRNNPPQKRNSRNSVGLAICWSANLQSREASRVVRGCVDFDEKTLWTRKHQLGARRSKLMLQRLRDFRKLRDNPSNQGAGSGGTDHTSARHSCEGGDGGSDDSATAGGESAFGRVENPPDEGAGSGG